MGAAHTNLTERYCPACGERASCSAGEKDGFQMLSCEACATLYIATLPDVSHGINYHGYYNAENLKVPAFISTILDEIIATFSPYRKHNRLLDVGCGSGTFLEAAARADWEATGLEVSLTAAVHVSHLGFDVFCGQLEKSDYPDKHFDVVILSEVLEHVPDPRALLAACARILRTGGLLWATTPHWRGISGRVLGLEWSAVCPPEHLQLFSVGGIRRLLTGEGLHKIRVATHGTNPYEIVHGMRRRVRQTVPNTNGSVAEPFERVESSYQLNEALRKGAAGRLLKVMLNKSLNLVRLGDSLKIRAEKLGQ
jgi:SAM-dependent methyltransferase